MTLQEVQQDWVKEINDNLAKFNIKVEANELKVYDASNERGMSRKLWLSTTNNNGEEMYFYMYITKQNTLKKYNGSVYANTKYDFKNDIQDYKYLGTVRS